MNTLAVLPGLSAWWGALDTPQQIFLGIGAVAGVITLALLVLTIFGLDHGGLADALNVDVDVAADAGAHGDGSLFSTRGVTGFFLGFGWAGFGVYDSSKNVPLAIAAGVVAGVALMFFLYWVAKKLLRLQSDGTVDFNAAVGAAGTVYITVPPGRASGGQAQVIFKNRHEIINVISDSAVPLPAGANIRVKERLAGNLFLVEAL
jgi:prepilin signal peptidase PulO-like enzyme (type II secretory pathway)